jgi:hypothetical protein
VDTDFLCGRADVVGDTMRRPSYDRVIKKDVKETTCSTHVRDVELWPIASFMYEG